MSSSEVPGSYTIHNPEHTPEALVAPSAAVIPISTTKVEQSLLLKCPIEIRHLINRYFIPVNATFVFLLLIDGHKDFVKADRGYAFPGLDQTIFRICGQINEECNEFLFKRNRFVLEFGQDLGRPIDYQTRCQLSYRQISMMRWCDWCQVRITLELRLGKRAERTSLSDDLDGPIFPDLVLRLTMRNGDRVRSLVRRIVDCWAGSHINKLSLYVLDNVLVTRGNEGDDGRFPNGVRISVLRAPMVHGVLRTIRSTFQHILDPFTKLEDVGMIDVSGNILQEEYVKYIINEIAPADSPTLEPSPFKMPSRYSRQFWGENRLVKYVLVCHHDVDYHRLILDVEF